MPSYLLAKKISTQSEEMNKKYGGHAALLEAHDIDSSEIHQ